MHARVAGIQAGRERSTKDRRDRAAVSFRSSRTILAYCRRVNPRDALADTVAYGGLRDFFRYSGSTVSSTGWGLSSAAKARKATFMLP